LIGTDNLTQQSTTLTTVSIIKKSQQIPKGYSEAVNPRRTDDIIANRIKTSSVQRNITQKR